MKIQKSIYNGTCNLVSFLPTLTCSFFKDSFDILIKGELQVHPCNELWFPKVLIIRSCNAALYGRPLIHLAQYLQTKQNSVMFANCKQNSHGYGQHFSLPFVKLESSACKTDASWVMTLSPKLCNVELRFSFLLFHFFCTFPFAFKWKLRCAKRILIQPYLAPSLH